MLMRNLKVLAVVAAISATTACTDDPAAPQSVNLDFAAKVAGADFTCGDTYPNVGSGNHTYKVTDYRMYINNVHVHNTVTNAEIPVELDQDGVWQLDNVVMLDFEDSSASSDCTAGTPETNTQVLGTIDGTLDLSDVEICFEVGLPFDKNHIDESTAQSPLNSTGMLWAWKIGRKYIRIDGVGDVGGTDNPFNLHLGAQGDCGTGAANEVATQQCSFPNTFEVCIANLDVNNDVIAVDVAGVLAGNDISMNLSTSGMGPTSAKPGCQSFIQDEDCLEVFPRMALDYTAYGNVTGTSSTPLQQQMFSKQ